MKLSNIWFALILIALALFPSAALNVSASSPSPRPTPKPNESAALGNQQSHQQVTPIGISDSSQPSQQTGTPKGEQTNGSDTATGLIAAFTIVMALATIAIAKFNRQFVGVTHEMTKATAEAAKFTKLAYIANRPYLIPDNFVMLNFTTQARRTDQHGLVFMTVEFVIKNVGKGPAIVEKAGAKLKILPDDPTNHRGWYPNPSDDWGDLSDCVALALDSQVIAADGTAKAQVLANLPSDDEYLALRVAFTKHIVVYGSLDYLDAAGEPYSAIFGRIYRPKDMLNDAHFTVGPRRYNRT
jgi:hypothetical protein